jgi:hypothetical protein
LQTELKLNDPWSLVSPCPLGNRAEDIEAWEASQKGLYADDSRQQKFNFGTSDLPIFNVSKYNRIIAYIEKCVCRGATLPLHSILEKACKAIGAGTSERNLKYYIREIRKKFYVFGGRGRGKILFVRLKSRFRKGASVLDSSKKNKNKVNTRAIARHTRQIPEIKRLAFAVIQGRKPVFGFGKSWNCNDPNWQTLKDCHWDNCKILFMPKMLYGTIYEALKKGCKSAEIVSRYDDLLRKWHGIAVDQFAENWLPSGLISELRQDLNLVTC